MTINFYRKPQFSLKARFSLITLVLLLSAAFVFPTIASADATATISVKSDGGLQLGQPILVSGSGFSAGEKIAFWLTSPHDKVFDAEYANVGADGTITGFPLGGGNTDATNNITVGSGAGVWSVTAKGLTSGTTAVTTFTIISPKIAVAGVNVGGNVFVVAYAGAYFFPEEKVSLWVTFPDGSVGPLAYTFADKRGNIPDPTKFGFVFSGPVGEYALTAEGAISKTPTIVHFSVVNK